MKKGYAISLALNGGLAVALMVLAPWQTRTGGGTGSASANAAPAAAGSKTGQTPAPAVGRVAIGGDWRNWIEPLRAAQVPTDVLAGLVQADFDRRWQSRQSALQEKYMRGEIDADGLAAAGLEREAELDRELQAALGPEPYREWDRNRVLQGLNVNQVALSDRERDAVYGVERAVRDQSQRDQAEKLRGTIDQATLDARQQAAQKAAAEKLRALLGEQRASQLQGADDTLGTLKRSLDGLALPPEQLTALAEVQQRWDRSRSELVTRRVNTQDPAFDAEIRASEEKWRADFEQVAGPEAYDRFVQAQDSRYTDLRRNAARWGVAPGAVDRLFATIENFEDTVHEYSLDAGARDADAAMTAAAVRRFAHETEQAMKAQLDAETLRRLKANGIKPVPAQ